MPAYHKLLKLRVWTSAIAIVGVMQLSNAAWADDNAKTKYGITVTTCTFDYDDENFCADGRMQTFAKIMKVRQANFAKDRLLYIYKPKESYGYRMVSIDKSKQTVTPFYWSFSEASQAVNSKGEKLVFDFDKATNEFCFKGNIGAYRNAYDYDPDNYPEFCFDYDKDKNAFGWFKQ